MYNESIQTNRLHYKIQHQKLWLQINESKWKYILNYRFQLGSDIEMLSIVGLNVIGTEISLGKGPDDSTVISESLPTFVVRLWKPNDSSLRRYK